MVIAERFDVQREGARQRVACQKCRTSWLRDTDDEVLELIARHIEEAKVALLG